MATCVTGGRRRRCESLRRRLTPGYTTDRGREREPGRERNRTAKSYNHQLEIGQ